MSLEDSRPEAAGGRGADPLAPCGELGIWGPSWGRRVGEPAEEGLGEPARGTGEEKVYRPRLEISFWGPGNELLLVVCKCVCVHPRVPLSPPKRRVVHAPKGEQVCCGDANVHLLVTSHCRLVPSSPSAINPLPLQWMSTCQRSSPGAPRVCFQGEGKGSIWRPL